MAIRRWVVLAAAAWLLLASRSAMGQAKPAAFDATGLRAPADLGSVWLIHGGDDMAYAQPDFDDSGWTSFDPHKSLVPVFPKPCPEVVWYRQRIKVSPDQTGLALRELNISRAFEIYVNGERLIASGSVAPFRKYTSGARILARIPDRIVKTGLLVIALRVHITQLEWAGGQNPGLYSSNLTIGQESTLYQDDWLGVIGANALNWLDKLLLVALGLVALVLYFAQRRQTLYLWIFASGALTFATFPQTFIAAFYDIPAQWEVLSILLRFASPFLYAGLYFSFVHQRIGLRWRAFLLFAGIMNVVAGLTGVTFISPLPLQLISNLPFIVLLAFIMPAVLAIHWRRGNREAGILLIPAMLFSLYIYAEFGFGTLLQFPAWRDTAIRGLNMIDRYPAGPFAISLDSISGILSTLSLAIIMLLRSTTSIRRQTLLESEFAAAQQVQEVLVPEQVGDVPGFSVESVYEPAQQVGGDYFQVLPAIGGGLLVVVGDVAGKGLPAAMLVSVLIGAIRTAAEDTDAPETLLRRLNDRLVGRSSQDGFSTALVARIASDGLVTIANAGHLSPYLDGREVELPGALPLGVMSGARYETSEFHLPHGSRLTFYSDGVVEAQNHKGELFGFERGRELSTRPAAAIVEAAKKFGQQDDITVVAIERIAVLASVA